MNGSRSFCPRCKQDVVFIDVGQRRRCTVCGFEFELSPLPVQGPNQLESVVMTVGHVLLRVCLIIAVLILVGVGIIFASCALHF